MDKSIIKKSWICVAMMAVILIADQVLKIWVKTHFAIGDEAFGLFLMPSFCTRFNKTK